MHADAAGHDFIRDAHSLAVCCVESDIASQKVMRAGDCFAITKDGSIIMVGMVVAGKDPETFAMRHCRKISLPVIKKKAIVCTLNVEAAVAEKFYKHGETSNHSHYIRIAGGTQA